MENEALAAAEKKEAVHSQDRDIWMGPDQVTVETAPRPPPVQIAEEEPKPRVSHHLNLQFTNQ